MPRRSSAELENEYKRLMAQLEALTSYLADTVSADVAPARIAAEIRRTEGLSAAIAGIKQAISDFLEPLQYASKEEAAAVDLQLARAGSPPLHVLLAAQAKTVRRILKQRQLNSETEYHLIKEIVINVDSWLTESQRALAETMMEQFERRASGAV